ncbi:MAG TPA: PQQ-binding-like beta-propeller repeat protein [Anaerolineae bacterium]|nr:PQQ-binding-like beta-propeller repeat protein [Anaerolineae bacterium]
MDNESTNEAECLSSPRGLRRANWSLITGGLLVLLVAVLAIAGPKLAPRDPLEENPVIKVGDQWDARPFAAFTPGFPLGSDALGRDLLSRLLWGIGPAIVLVSIVAAVRLALGLMIGLGAGWSAGRIGRALDAAIGAALTLPVLIVALAAIAAIGVEIGVLAFVIGLSITGWAETAQVVRDQTRIVKGEDYVESARGLGESGLQIVVRHVRRQVLPLAWMLFAFEVSGALMVTAQLGFLGYYVGGDYWYAAGDYSAHRASGMPELGQLLATSSHSFLEDPWGMFAVGSVIFMAILGFNLVGQGMRQRLSSAPASKPTLYARTLGRAGAWIEERIMSPLSGRDRKVLMGASLALGLIAIGAAGISFLNAQAAAQPQGPVADLVIPGEHLWATERHDPWGTLWTPAHGPSAAPKIEWVFEDASGFIGGPAIAADGTLYIASKGGTLHAIDSGGSVRWQAALPTEPVGTPALDAAGNVYVADEEGLSAIAPDGELKWRFRPEKGIAISGPIVAPDGTIYYAHGGGFVQAVSPEGQSLWRERARKTAFQSEHPPQISPNGEWVLLENGLLRGVEGSLHVFAGLPTEFSRYLVGADGRTYLLAGHIVSEWRQDGLDARIVQIAEWESRGISIWVPSDAGITRDQMIWMQYGSARAPTQIAWLDPTGRVLGTLKIPQNPSRAIAVDGDSTIYVCADIQQGHPAATCFAFAPESEEPVWQITLEQGEVVEGGAVVPGRLYVAIREGFLYAIGESQP